MCSKRPSDPEVDCGRGPVVLPDVDISGNYLDREPELDRERGLSVVNEASGRGQTNPTEHGEPADPDFEVEQDIRHIAWHEAGHAIVAAALGQRVEVSISASGVIDDDPFRGSINTWGVNNAYETIPVLFAGYFAERMINPDRSIILKAASRDFACVRRLDPYLNPNVPGAAWRRATFASRSKWEAFVRHQMHIAGRLLRQHRHAHRALVEVLLEVGDLDVAEFAKFADMAGLRVRRDEKLTASGSPDR